MKKVLKIILFLFICLSVCIFLSCSGDKNNDKDTSDSVNNTGDRQDNESIQKLDFKGETLSLNVSCNAADSGNTVTSDAYITGPAEDSGEIVMDAVIKRNYKIEELLNLNVKYTLTDKVHDDVTSYIRTMILAGIDEYDLYINDTLSLPVIVGEGLAENAMNGKYFDFSKPWWWSDFMANVTPNTNKQYYLIGDYFMDMLRQTHIILVNTDLFSKLYGDPNDLYKIVFDGKWTYDVMLSYVKDTYKDLNGSGKVEKDKDQFGLSTHGTGGSVIPHCTTTDVSFISRDSEGYPYFDVNMERATYFLEKLIELFYSPGTARFDNYPDWMDKFVNGEALFVNFIRIGHLENIRDMANNYGVLVYPKLDSLQENYKSIPHDTAECGLIPVTCEKLDMLSAFLEAVNEETYKSVTPVYFETALKVKYARDDQTPHMLDIIKNSITSEFTCFSGEIMGTNATLSMTNMYPYLVSKKSSGLASRYEMLYDSANAKLTDFIDSYKALN